MFEKYAQWYFGELILLICAKLKINTENTDGTEALLESLNKNHPEIYEDYNRFISEYLKWAKKVDESQEIKHDEIILRDSLLKKLVKSVNTAEK